MEYHIICRIKKDRIKNGKPKTVKLFASRANGLALSVVDQLVSEWILCSVLINTDELTMREVREHKFDVFCVILDQFVEKY